MLAHIAEVPGRRTPFATWHDLGAAAGSVAVGVRLADTAPGKQATPLHGHGAEEEMAFVLAGGGACVTEDGEAAELRPLDALCRLAGGPAHTFVAGPEGLRLLVFGERRPAEVLRMPRTGANIAGRAWWPAGEGSPYPAEAALPPVAVPEPPGRPPWVVASGEVPTSPWSGAGVDARGADLGRAMGSRTTGLRLVRVAPGARGVRPHCHSSEEELLFVLEGSGVFEVGEARLAVRAGHLLSRPAGTGVAHSYVAGPDGMAVLAYGQRDPGDMAFYPRSQTVFLRGLGVRFRIEQPTEW